MSPRETGLHEDVTIMDLFRILCLEESQLLALPEVKIQVLLTSFRARPRLTRTQQLAQPAYIARNWRTAPTHESQSVSSFGFMDMADVKGLTSAFATMVAPVSKGQVLLTSFKFGCLARAETALKDD